jgi:hypothetical protein
VRATKDMVSILLAACTKGTHALPAVEFVQHSCGRKYVIKEFDQVRPLMLILFQCVTMREPVNVFHGCFCPLMLLGDILIEVVRLPASEYSLHTLMLLFLLRKYVCSRAWGKDRKRRVRERKFVIVTTNSVGVHVELREEAEVVIWCLFVLTAFDVIQVNSWEKLYGF